MTLQRARRRDDWGALGRDALHRASEGEAQHYQWYGGPAMGRSAQAAAAFAQRRGREACQMIGCGRVNATIFTAVGLRARALSSIDQRLA